MRCWPRSTRSRSASSPSSPPGCTGPSGSPRPASVAASPASATRWRPSASRWWRRDEYSAASSALASRKSNQIWIPSYSRVRGRRQVISVVVSGAAGRMGQAVCEAVDEAEDMELAAGADPALGVELIDVLEGADVIVDFTTPETAPANVRAAL